MSSTPSLSPSTPALADELVTAVQLSRADLVRHLLSQGAPVHTLKPFHLACSMSLEIFQLAIDHSWDLNQHDPDHGAGPGKSLLHYAVANEGLVRWCLEHGASIVQERIHQIKDPALLETAARVGTVATFKLLRKEGAASSPRMLHRAVGAAASCSKTNEPQMYARRMKMVKYLVNDLGLNVNALDSEEKSFNHYGTPLCYAAEVQGRDCDCEEVVRFLLERGADPYIRDRWDMWDAIQLAEKSNNQKFLDVVEEWKEGRARSGA